MHLWMNFQRRDVPLQDRATNASSSEHTTQTCRIQNPQSVVWSDTQLDTENIKFNSINTISNQYPKKNA